MQRFSPNTLVSLLLSAVFSLSAASCATPSPPTPPVVVAPPRIPQPPQVSEPLPSGAYWQRHCELMLKVQQLLKETPTPCEQSSPPGQATAQP